MAMELYPVPSLQRIAALKVITHLYQLPDNLKTIVSLHFDVVHFPRKDIFEHKLTRFLNGWDRVDYRRRLGLVPLLEKLALPDSVLGRLVALCEPVALQLVLWGMALKKFLCEHDCILSHDCGFVHNCHLPHMANILECVCWTYDGRVDTSQTINELIIRAEEEPFVRHKHFGLMCKYYLERGPFSEWVLRQTSTNTDLKLGSREEEKIKSIPKIFRRLLQYERKKDSIVDLEFWKSAWNHSLKLCDERGLNHAWKKLLVAGAQSQISFTWFVSNQSLAVPYLSRWWIAGFQHPSRPEIVRLVISRLCEQQMMEPLKTIIRHDGLKCFLEWPYQDIFLNVVRLVNWSFADVSEFSNLLQEVLERIPPDGFEDLEPFDYRQLWRDFWNQAPPACKNSLLVQSGGLVNLILAPCQVSGSTKRDLLAFILKDLGCEEKRSYFSMYGLIMCKYVTALGDAELMNFAVDQLFVCDEEQDGGSRVREKVLKQIMEWGWISRDLLNKCCLDGSSQQEEEEEGEKEEEKEVEKEEEKEAP